LLPCKQYNFLLHNSTDTGRTGTYIAIDQLINELRNKEDVDVMRIVSSLRECRKNMVVTMVSL